MSTINSFPVRSFATWMGDCLQRGKPSQYITNTKVNSAFHPSGVSKYQPGSHVWLELRQDVFTCVRWQVIPYGRWRSVALRCVSHK